MAESSPPQRIRLVATDLDGTLLRRDQTISPHTCEVLQRARSEGLVIVAVTARSPRRLNGLDLAAATVNLAICSNGALVYDLQRAVIVSRATFAPTIVERVIQRIKGALPEASFAAEVELDFQCEPAYLMLAPALTEAGQEPRVSDAASWGGDLVNKLLLRHPSVAVDELLRLVQTFVGTDVAASHSGGGFVEIAATGVTKALALEQLCQEMGLTAAEVAAFGDMPNDLPMLAWAGLPIAVANAHPDVLAVASRLTASNEEDGVAAEVERLLSEMATPGAV